MTNTGRKLGVNIITLMRNAGLSRAELAEKLKCSYRDMCRILEGRLMLPPEEVRKIAELFGKTEQELLHYEHDEFIPELQYMKEFSDTDNIDKILDLMDELVDLMEII